MSREDDILDSLYDLTIDGERDKVVALTNESLELGMDPLVVLFDALIPALEEVGRQFEAGTFFVPEMLVAAKAMQGAMDVLRPLLAKTDAKPLGTFVMGTVKGDIHDIGKNLCNIMLEGAGFNVIDLGVNVQEQTFLDAIREHKPDALGLSAFLTTTMPMFIPLIAAIEEAGLRDGLLIYVGGAPVTQEYCDKVGADGYSPNASALVRHLKEKMGIKASG
ncbi:MAG: corrinoid protein [Anaerolineae bacterium]|nr:corrinoid protein [Anaerolineae bacterium]MDK1080023.1 corrinoid protein [Anaerolineae bacterium]MDK1117250.1 corrinoid protein [Anaerolineae bacterium]